MYVRRIRFKHQRLSSLVQQSKYYSRFNSHGYSGVPRLIPSAICLIGNYPSKSPFPLAHASERNFTRLKCPSDISWRNCLLRYYSSKGDGRNANEDKFVTSQDMENCHKENNHKENTIENSRNYDAHARLGEQDQMEWLKNEKLAIENKRKESPSLTRHERLKNEFLRKVVPWEKITLSWDTFPYYLDEHSKNLLVECVASHVKHKKVASDYGSYLLSSEARILIQSIPGTKLYRERLVRALARDLQVPLMVLDGSILAPYGLSDYEDESDEENSESTSESDDKDENDASNAKDCANNAKDCTSSGETKTVGRDDEVVDLNASAEALKKSIPGSIEESGKSVSGESESSSTSSQSEHVESPDKANRPLKKAKDIEHDLDAQTHDCYVGMEVLCQVLESQQPIIVYFSDSYPWFSMDVSKSYRKEFGHKLQKMFSQLSGPIVFICGRNKAAIDPKEEKFPMILPNLGGFDALPFPLKKLTEGSKGRKPSKEDEIYMCFPNVMDIHPPREEDHLKTFNKHIEEDRKIVISRSNLTELHKVLEENKISCMDLLHVNTDGVILTEAKAEVVVRWAKSHYLSLCPLPSIKEDRLQLPRDSLEIALMRLKAQETASKKPSQHLKNLAKGEFERKFVSAVVRPGEIGVRFDDVGALEDVKKALKELVILPMRRPELFSHGILLRPCKGILLFGPPGTGKTLLAKALATEAEANFISITGSTLTSKWYGDEEKLTEALFSFASKLAPVIIFVDEIDSLLGARGGYSEHEATRKMRNEFMAAWDGLRSKERQRILILGATNRPFDLDDAVIRRLPRRIYVDLPDTENRRKILKIMLAQENLEAGFPLEQLANATEGYSGSDLKNLCVAAAYRPVQELLVEEENKSHKVAGLPALRPLKLEDFVQSKDKVGPSVAHDAVSMNNLRKWNEQYGEGGSRRKSRIGF